MSPVLPASSRTAKPYIVMGMCVVAFFALQLPTITAPFIDGRYHQNWNPPFWMINAQATNRAGIAKSFFGVAEAYETAPDGTTRATAFYASHPQLIGPVTALWTRVFGYAEWSARLLSLLIVAASACIFFSALVLAWPWPYAASAAGLFFALPLVQTYGAMLNHEPFVLFFFTLAFLGVMRMVRGMKKGLALLLAGTLGMALSDWSGFLFGALLALFFFIPPLSRVDGSRRARWLVAGMVGLGLVLFAAQSYLQAGMPSTAAFFSRYVDLWRYRSGSETPMLWFTWLRKEMLFLNLNFSLILWGIGLAGIIAAVRAGYRRRGVAHTTDTAERAVVLVMAVATVGQIAYLLAVRQAAFVHAYYQYFFSLPTAAGVVLAARHLAGYARAAIRPRVVTGIAIVAIAGSGAWSVWITAVLLPSLMWGTASDIQLITSLRALPEDARVVVVDNTVALEWFANPNIRYYAERPIERYTLEQVPFAPYQIVPAHMAPQLQKILASGAAFGTPVKADILRCSTHFCLLVLNEGETPADTPAP